MKFILSILMFVSCSSLSFGQFNKYEKSDTLFKCYKVPIIDKSIYEQLEKDDAILYVGCYFKTDTSGNIISHKFIPFFEVGNMYKPEDTIWQSIFASLITASTSWIFKPSLWSFKKDKKLEADVNKNPMQRPFTGRSRYFIIFEVSGIQGTSIDKISFINDFKINK